MAAITKTNGVYGVLADYYEVRPETQGGFGYTVALIGNDYEENLFLLGSSTEEAILNILTRLVPLLTASLGLQSLGTIVDRVKHHKKMKAKASSSRIVGQASTGDDAAAAAATAAAIAAADDNSKDEANKTTELVVVKSGDGAEDSFDDTGGEKGVKASAVVPEPAEAAKPVRKPRAKRDSIFSRLPSHVEHAEQKDHTLPYPVVALYLAVVLGLTLTFFVRISIMTCPTTPGHWSTQCIQNGYPIFPSLDVRNMKLDISQEQDSCFCRQAFIGGGAQWTNAYAMNDYDYGEDLTYNPKHTCDDPAFLKLIMDDLINNPKVNKYLSTIWITQCAAFNSSHLVDILKLPNLKILVVSNMSSVDEIPETARIPNSVQVMQLSGLGKRDGALKVPATLGNATSLSTVYMEENGHADVPNFLRHIPTLSFINMNRNAIKAVPTWFVEVFGKTMSILRIEHNQLTELPANFGTGMIALGSFYARDNKLKALPDVSGLTELTELFIGDNMITEWPAGYEKMENLGFIWAPSNAFTKLPANFCTAHPRAWQLNFARSFLKALPDMKDCTRLKYSSWAGNLFTAVPTGLTSIGRTNWLDLEYTNITSLAGLAASGPSGTADHQIRLGGSPLCAGGVKALQKLLDAQPNGKAWSPTCAGFCAPGCISGDDTWNIDDERLDKYCDPPCNVKTCGAGDEVCRPRFLSIARSPWLDADGFTVQKMKYLTVNITSA